MQTRRIMATKARAVYYKLPPESWALVIGGALAIAVIIFATWGQ